VASTLTSQNYISRLCIQATRLEDKSGNGDTAGYWMEITGPGALTAGRGLLDYCTAKLGGPQCWSESRGGEKPLVI
jgi:hypothetical protein